MLHRTRRRGEGVLDWVEVRRVTAAGRGGSRRPPRSNWRTLGALWLHRLSIKTTWPGLSSEPEPSRHRFSSADRLMGRSSTKGAIMPRMVSPATKVVVFQWPCGTPTRKRSPRRQRPYIGPSWSKPRSRSMNARRHVAVIAMFRICGMKLRRKGCNLRASRLGVGGRDALRRLYPLNRDEAGEPI